MNIQQDSRRSKSRAERLYETTDRLDSRKQVNVVEIRWPSGRVQKLDNVPVNQVLTVRESAEATELSTK